MEMQKETARSRRLAQYPALPAPHLRVKRRAFGTVALDHVEHAAQADQRIELDFAACGAGGALGRLGARPGGVTCRRGFCIACLYVTIDFPIH